MSDHHAHKASIAAKIIAKLAKDGFAIAALDGTSHDLFPVAMDRGVHDQRHISKPRLVRFIIRHPGGMIT